TDRYLAGRFRLARQEQRFLHPLLTVGLRHAVPYKRASTVVATPGRRLRAELALESAGEGSLGFITVSLSDAVDGLRSRTQGPGREGQPPVGEVLHGRFADQFSEALAQGRARERRLTREFIHRPCAARFGVQQRQSLATCGSLRPASQPRSSSGKPAA